MPAESSWTFLAQQTENVCHHCIRVYTVCFTNAISLDRWGALRDPEGQKQKFWVSEFRVCNEGKINTHQRIVHTYSHTYSRILANSLHGDAVVPTWLLPHLTRTHLSSCHEVNRSRCNGSTWTHSTYVKSQWIGPLRSQ